ncbi:MAG: class I SAM-dependent methyltransferase [Pseudomonadota bacterium]
MTTRELGLVLAQQLLDVDDLHYGLWDAGLEPSLGNLRIAQQRYSELLLDTAAEFLDGQDFPHILDVGCGTGRLAEQLLARGWQVTAVSPSRALAEQARKRLAAYLASQARLLECRFEDLPAAVGRFELVLFSESFQYIPLQQLLQRLPGLLVPGGKVLVCDFFKTAAHGDGGVGDRSFGGGHLLTEFYRQLEASSFALLRDTDLTRRISPTIELLDDWLNDRLIPAAGTMDDYLLDNYPRLTGLLKWLLRHKLARLRYKYLAGNRSRAVFEQYKSYRLLVFKVSQEPVGLRGS